MYSYGETNKVISKIVFSFDYKPSNRARFANNMESKIFHVQTNLVMYYAII